VGEVGARGRGKEKRREEKRGKERRIPLRRFRCHLCLDYSNREEQILCLLVSYSIKRRKGPQREGKMLSGRGKALTKICLSLNLNTHFSALLLDDDVGARQQGL
jgi:hypothetical protein